MNLCEKEMCTGCGACMQACPKKAMTVHKDRKDFIDNLDKGVYKALLKTETGKDISKVLLNDKVKSTLKKTVIYKLLRAK